MSKATIVRMKKSDAKGERPSTRSGRYSAQEAYRAQAPEDGTRPGEASSEPPRLRVLPPLRPRAEPQAESGAASRAASRKAPRIEKDRPGMATDYSLRLGPGKIARIKLERRATGHSWIDWVFVPPGFRGTGTGSILMARVLADADAFGVRLSLEARACAGPDQAALEAWYAGLGFTPSGIRGTFGPVLVRRPVRGRAERRAA